MSREEHDVRFYGANSAFDPHGLSARCDPCEWAVTIEGGHTLTELARLDAMHAGVTGPGQPPAGPTSVLPDGSATVTYADLQTILAALHEAAAATSQPAAATQYRAVATRLGDDG